MRDAIALKNEDKPNLAVAKLSRALVLQPDNPALFRERAEAYVMLSDFYGAIINLKRVMDLRAEDREEMTLKLGQLYYQYGLSLASENQHEDALAMFVEAELHDSTNEHILTRR